jgi:uncharacterized protein (TIGR02246 family)
MNMRGIVTMLVLVGAAGACAVPDAGLTPADELEITELVAQWDRNTLANRVMDNLDLLADDAVELLATPRVGKEAIRQRWEGFVADEVYTSAHTQVREIAGLGDLAYVWAEFDYSFEEVGEPTTHRGNVIWIMRKDEDGRWKIYRASWMSAAVGETGEAIGS